MLPKRSSETVRNYRNAVRNAPEWVSAMLRNLQKGDRKGQHSIRINDQWRICFRWTDGAEDVEIVDYH